MNTPVDSSCGACGAPAPTNGRRAFTLIELMVSVVILAILILIFSGVLSQAQGVVNRSQEDIRIDRDMLAVEEILRRELSKISKSGFLKITGGEHIAFTILGNFESISGIGSANAAIVDYGCTTEDDDGTSDDNIPPANVMWRRQLLLMPGVDTEDDHVDATIAEAADEVDEQLYKGQKRRAPEIKLPPDEAADWASYVVGECTDFKVFWWDGTKWSADGASGSWTNEDPSNWPRAVRVQFKLRGKSFEILVNTG